VPNNDHGDTVSEVSISYKRMSRGHREQSRKYEGVTYVLLLNGAS